LPAHPGFFDQQSFHALTCEVQGGSQARRR
jgi:hypothetical protein